MARTTAGFASHDKEDIMMEFNSHIYETIQRNQRNPAMENLLNALESLGEPEEVLHTLIADKTLNKAIPTFNPISVFQAISLNLRNGFIYNIFALL